MSAPPSFQFYASDFVGGTMSFNAEQAGAYIFLLCYQWMNGNVPDDDAALAGIGRCSSAAVAVVRRKFVKASDGVGLVNERLEKVRAAQNEYRTKQAENGRKGGLLSKHRSSTAQAPLPASVEQRSSSPISDLRSPIVPVQSTAQAPLEGFAPQMVDELHAIWQQRTGLEAKRAVYERAWYDFLMLGWRKAELELVIEHSKVLNKGRDEQYHTPLALGKLIGDQRTFADRLQVAQAWEKAGRSQDPKKAGSNGAMAYGDPKNWKNWTEQEVNRWVASGIAPS